MVEKSNEEYIDLDRLNDGVSEIRPYKSKQAKVEEKLAKIKEKQEKQDSKKASQPKNKEKTDSKKKKSEKNEAPAEKPEKKAEECAPPPFKAQIVDVDDDFEPVDGPVKNKKRKKEKLKVSRALILIVSVLFFVSVVGYSAVAFWGIPFFVKWRNIWIETAMTTDQHRWLATSFFPEWLITDVMSRQVDIKDISVTEISKDEKTSPFGDVIDPSKLTVGEPDEHGNTVYANDIEQGIVILEVKSSSYTGKLVIIDDPSRIFLGVTDYKHSRGEFICDYLEKEDAVVGINASGFIDTGGVSLGGDISGQCVSRGEYWGENKSKYTLIGFDDKDRLVVGGIADWSTYNIRDGMQFRPTLILNGKKVVEDSAGWGLQPRTTIGQCANGVVLMLVMDGRQPGYSLGATMEDCADILLTYGAVNAAACDGGSSSVIGYNGEVINKPSARDMPTGRYLPNAWLVKRK